ncbi:MAG: DedA family protein [Actinomycetota bacterium]
MDFLSNIVDFVLHLDVHLSELIADFGPWIHVILFLVIVAETGLVVAPLLPGDSLLFAAGTFAARGDLNVWVLFVSLTVAAILGDALNYAIGRYLGPKLFRKERSRFFKKENLDRTHDFFERYGPATIIIARFLPIVRTFAPFVAGMGRMGYPRFLTYNVIGGVGWVAIFTFVGYFFANIPFVRNHFPVVIIAIVLVSLVPAVAEVVRRRRRAAAGAAASSPSTDAP